MADEPADVPPRCLRDQSIPLGVEEQVLPVFPKAHVDVHPRAVVAEQRLRHEGDRVPMPMTHVLHEVLVHHELVGHAGERGEPHVDLRLACRPHLVVVDFHLDARRNHRQHDLGAQVLQPVGRRHREVALLVARPVAQVGRAVRAGVPDAFFRIDVVVAFVRVLVEPHGVEDVELRLGPVVRRGGDARLHQVLLRLLRHIARVPRIPLEGHRIYDVARQREGRHVQAGIHERRIGIRHQQHVALVDRLKAPDGRAVEAEAFGEQLLRQLLQRDREMLPGAGKVGEPDVHHLHTCFLRAPNRVGGRRSCGGFCPLGSLGGFQRRSHGVALLNGSRWVGDFARSVPRTTSARRRARSAGFSLRSGALVCPRIRGT